MIITLNSADLTNVLQNTSITDRTYKIQALNEFLRKGELNIRYTFLAKPIDGVHFPIYPMLNFYASDNSKNQDINSIGVLSILQPKVTPQFTNEVFSTSEDYDPDLVYYYPFSDGNNLLVPTPSPNLVPNNISFQYGTGPFAGVSAIDITASGGYFELPKKLQVSDLDLNWGFSIFLNNNSSNFRILRIRKQDGRNLDGNETPRFAVTMTTTGQIRIIAVNRFDQWVIDWVSNTSIPLAQWGHLLLSFSETGHRVYINGAEDLGSYTLGTENTFFNFSDLLPFDINRFRLADSQASFAQVTWYHDTVMAAEASQMQVNTFPYTTSSKVAFHYPLNNSLQPSAGYNLIDFTNGGLSYSSSVSKPGDTNGSASLSSSGISALPPNFQPIRGLDDYSFSFWVRPTSSPMWLFRINDLRIILIVNAAGNIVFELRGEVNTNILVRCTSVESYLNQWVHICVCISTTQGNRLYINGIQETNYNISDQNFNFLNSDFIDGNLFNRFALNGTINISDYAVWNKFLTQEEAQDMYEGNFNYKILYSIPTGVISSYGGQIIHKTACHKTQTIQLRQPSDRLRVRLGSTVAINPAQIENYILTLYINE